MTAPGCFVLGTDTDAGKTVVAAGLLRWLRDGGAVPAPVKPVQTGATRASDGWYAPDLDVLLAGARLAPDASAYARMAPCCYAPACSPHLAAREAGRPVDHAAIHDAVGRARAEHEAVVVEGAGGALVPLDDAGTTMADLAAALGIPALVVGRAGLGTLNHTLLTLEALRARGVTVAAVVLTATQPVPDAGTARLHADNAATIARLGAVTVAGPLPHRTQPAPDAVAADLAAAPGLAAALAAHAALPLGASP